MDIWFEAFRLSSPYFIGTCLALCALLTARAYILFAMAETPEISQFPNAFSTKYPAIYPPISSDDAGIVLSGQRHDLRPVEFAYLMRGGDASHATAVLVVDLLQRAVKSQTSEISLPLTEYEVKMWEIVKSSIKTWAAEKKDAVLLESFKKDPVAYVRRWSGIYLFLKRNFKPFVSGVAKDPRHLRKYFSFGGVVKLLADFSTAGYQQAFERELKENLLNRGLLVTNPNKERASRLCFAVALAGFVCSALFGVFVLHSFTIFFISVVIAALTRGIMFTKQLIPYYVDVLNLFGHIQRGGIRVTLLKTFATLLNNTFLAVSISTFSIGTFCQFLYIRFYIHDYVHTYEHIYIFLLSAALSLFLIVCFDIALSAWRVSLEEWPTTRGHKYCERIRKNIRTASPLDEFKNVLQTPDYDETFSDVVALYGIETLFFLA